MDDHSGHGDLTSLRAALRSGLMPQFLTALGEAALIVDGDGRPVTSIPLNAGTVPLAIDHLGENFLQGLRAVLANRSDGFDHVDAGSTPEHGARYRVLPLRPQAGGMAIGAVIVRHGLAEVLRAEQRVRDSMHFVGSLVHDLRTELNAVIGFSEMMMQECWGALGDDHYRDYARHIHLSGSHLLHQVNQLLDLARADFQGREVEEEEFDLADLLHQCCESVGVLAERNGLEMALTPTSAPIIRADPSLTRRVALNLLSNAIKFTPTGGRVSACVGIDHHGRPYLTVKDTGIGIAAEHLSKVMHPFARLANAHAPHPDSPGSGLGLPLSKRLMELQGGSLVLDSQPERGTTVTAWFPPHSVIAIRDTSLT